MKSGASSTGPPPTRRDIEGETAEVLSTLLTLLPHELLIVSPNLPNGPHTARHPLLAQSLQFQASLVADLVHFRKFEDKETWNRCLAVYLTPWLGADKAQSAAETIRSHYEAIDLVSPRI